MTGVYGDRERCVEAWGEESKQRVYEFLPVLDKRLEHNDFIAVDHFTIVDITGFILISFAIKGLEIDVLSTSPNIARWYNQILARPAFQS